MSKKLTAKRRHLDKYTPNCVDLMPYLMARCALGDDIRYLDYVDEFYYTHGYEVEVTYEDGQETQEVSEDGTEGSSKKAR